MLDYWTPARMREAVPIEDLGRPPGPAPGPPLAGASSTIVPPAALQPPYSASGRIFGRAGGYPFSRSGVAVDTPTRRVVLTAGHCLVEREKGRNVSTEYLEFVPSFEARHLPYGRFVMKEAFVTKVWLRRQNINYDIAASSSPTPTGAAKDVADAVGGGAAVANDPAPRPGLRDLRLPRLQPAAMLLWMPS